MLKTRPTRLYEHNISTLFTCWISAYDGFIPTRHRGSAAGSRFAPARPRYCVSENLQTRLLTTLDGAL